MVPATDLVEEFYDSGGDTALAKEHVRYFLQVPTYLLLLMAVVPSQKVHDGSDRGSGDSNTKHGQYLAADSGTNDGIRYRIYGKV